MRKPLSLALVSIAAGAACGSPVLSPATPGPQPGAAPPVEEAAPEGDRIARRVIEGWLREFRGLQRRERDFTGRYGDEVTLDGRIDPLSAPYETGYSVHPTGKSYYVEVRYPPTRQSCKLEEGEDVHEAGRIVCQRY